jgi:hypothetical protein
MCIGGHEAVCFRRWRVYAERGLAGEPVAVWPYAEHLILVGKDEPLAQYRVTYQPDTRHLKAVAEAHRYETAHRSPQPPVLAVKLIRPPGPYG